MVWMASASFAACRGNLVFRSEGRDTVMFPHWLEERFWVQSHIPPPKKLAKTLSLHFDQPRQAPSLAGVFTWACGLGRPPQGLILAFLTPVSSLFLYSRPPPRRGGFFLGGWRLGPPAARPDFGVPDPVFLSLSLLPADAQTAKSARLTSAK